MNINVFGKYNVKRINNYSYISDRIGKEYFFSEDKVEEENILSGCKLMECVIEDMKSHDTISVTFTDNEIFIEQYNAIGNGESADIYYFIECVGNALESNYKKEQI